MIYLKSALEYSWRVYIFRF